MSSIRETAQASLTRARLHLDEATYRMEDCVDLCERSASTALTEIEAALFDIEDTRKAVQGLADSHESLESEVLTLREMIGEYEAKTEELEEAVRYLSGDRDEPVDDWKETCPQN
jgi:cob(I)alamin adenosyltransferase